MRRTLELPSSKRWTPAALTLAWATACGTDAPTGDRPRLPTALTPPSTPI